MYYEKAEHTEWVFETTDWSNGLVKVEYIMEATHSEYYKSAVSNSNSQFWDDKQKQLMKEFEQNEREKWVEEYNNSLPQEIYYDSDGEELTIGIGGIHCSERHCYVYENVDIYGRIKRMRGEQKTV
jgi:hypothetical protein